MQATGAPTGLPNTTAGTQTRTTTTGGGTAPAPAPTTTAASPLVPVLGKLIETLRTLIPALSGTAALGGGPLARTPVGPTDAAQGTSTTAPPATGRTYTVQPGDTLSRIARDNGIADWRQLYDANRDVIGANPDLIEPGQVLRLDAAPTTKMPLGGNATSTSTSPSPPPSVTTTARAGGAAAAPVPKPTPPRSTAPATPPPPTTQEAPAKPTTPPGAAAAPAPATSPAPEAPKPPDKGHENLISNLNSLKFGEAPRLSKELDAAKALYAKTGYLEDKHAVTRAEQRIVENNARIEKVQKQLDAYPKDPTRFAY